MSLSNNNSNTNNNTNNSDNNTNNNNNNIVYPLRLIIMSATLRI